MVVSAPEHQLGARRQRTIIERPRLIKLLDELEAKTILLLAPAGYGKTTLARQWAKTLRGAIWVSLAPAHRDVAALVHDVAEAINPEASALIGEHLKAQANPQRATRELGRALVGCLESSHAQWLILDEYEDIAGSQGAEELIERVVSLSDARILITSRLRPSWSTGRGVVYGQVAEIGQTELAMNDDEVALVLKPRSDAVAKIASEAGGWPAVIGLAAVAEPDSVPAGALPSALHRYLAEELYQRASTRLQDQLVTLALLSETSESALAAQFGEEAPAIIEEATRLGFSSRDDSFELHPLLRTFLLDKLAEDPDVDSRVEQAIAAHLEAEAWERAFELIVRFKRWNDVDGALRVAFKPLLRSGRLETLATFVGAIDKTSSFPLPAVEVALAELASRDGRFDLVADLVARAIPRLDESHPLSSRAALLDGYATRRTCDWERSVSAFERAHARAADQRDEYEAIYGSALTRTYGELPDAVDALKPLEAQRHLSPFTLVRSITAEIDHARLVGQINELPHLEDARCAMAHVDDPLARSSLAHVAAYALALSAQYDAARPWLDLAMDDIERFGLAFARPHVNWNAAQIALGQRRFAVADRFLQLVEDAASGERASLHELNARSLRARLLMQNASAGEALECVRPEPMNKLPSWAGEYLATRAMVFACLGETAHAFDTALAANETSSATEVRLLAQAARAIASADEDVDEGKKLIAMAFETGVWDPVVCAVRTSPVLASRLSSDPTTRTALGSLYQRTQDSALARRAGLRMRSTTPPNELLSPREFEVLGLIARGFRNQDISKALFIAESTTKVHIRHIFEKLGARTRAEAVARLEMFANDRRGRD